MVEITQEQVEREIQNIKNAQSKIGNIKTINNYCAQFQDVISDLRNQLNTEHGQTIAKELENIVNGDLDMDLRKLTTSLNTLVSDIQIEYSKVSKVHEG